MQYLKTKECETLVEVHVDTGYTLLDGEGTGENFYQFLELQMDDDKRTIETALRYFGSLKGFLNNYLASEIGTEEQWELDAGAFVYSQFFVAAYNTSYLTLNGRDPIYFKHTGVMRDDVMQETMNENNWHELLDSAIHSTLTGARGVDNPWIKNIFTNLNHCFNDYYHTLDNIACTYYRLLREGSKEKIIHVFRYLDIPARNLNDTMIELGFEKLFFKSADKFFEMNETPMNKSGTILPKINLPNRMDSGTALPVFSELYKKYRNTKAGWMLASFFVAQLFKEILSDNLESRMLIVNVLKGLLLNCSSRYLKTRPDRTEIVFNHIDNFEDTFQRALYQDLDMNKKDSKKLANKATATIQNEFEKTFSEIDEERENSKSSNSSSFFQKLKKKFSFSSNSSKIADVPDFRSQFHHKEKASFEI